MTTKTAELRASRELMVNLTLRELRGKYKRSVVGWGWSLLNPLATMLIFAVVFGLFLKVQVPKGEPSGLQVFALWLLCGILPWNFLANGMTGSMGTLLGNSNLIKKVYFPREVLVAANVASWVVSFLIELGVLSAALLISGNMVLPWLPLVVLIVAIQAVFVTGIGLVLSVLNVYFRDVQHFIAIFLQLLFYAAPVVYPISYVPVHAHVFGALVPLREIYRLNPLVRFLEIYRDLLYSLRFPSLVSIGYVTLWAAGFLALGTTVFWRMEGKLAEEL